MFLHTVNVQEVAISADGLYTYDLAVNPLSVLLVNLRPLNDTGTLANYPDYGLLVQAINRLTIAFRGESIVSASGRDIAAMNYFRRGIIPMQGNTDNTNNERRCATLPVFFGKTAYDSKSCFPASHRGELSMELDLDIADTGYDTLRLSVESIELLGAKPKEFEKMVTYSQTFSATGDQDFDLAPGNRCRGVLLFGTTGFQGASPAPTWGRVRTLLDNQEVGYGATDFEVAMMLGQLWGRQPPSVDQHKHIITTSGCAQTELATLAGPYDALNFWQNYAFLDFDPTKDDEHTLDTRNRSRFHLRANVETADAARAIPIEVIQL